MLLGVLRSLIWIWPFISEMFFAGKSFKVILKEHWFIAILLVFLALSLFINYVSLSKINMYITSDSKYSSKPVIDNKQKDNDVDDAKGKLKKIYNITENQL